MFKFLHTADIHLDSPLLNLGQYDGAPVDSFRSATRRAFDNVVDLAIAEQVRFVLIAGDLYDGDCRDFNTPQHFRRRMDKLGEHGIKVFIIQGNHDAQSSVTKAFRLQLPDNVHVFSTSRPETVRLGDPDVAIHGQGFAERAVLDDLSATYPVAETGCLNIGMLHTNCGGSDQHDPYAPSTVDGLRARGYDYWALGHIHSYQVLADPDPWIVYPGNPQGRKINEEGPKGCVIATVEDRRVTDVAWRPMDVLRWYRCLIDVSECGDAEAVVSAACQHVAEKVDTSDGRHLALRLELTGKTVVHRELSRHRDVHDRRIREAMVDAFDERVWIEKIRFKTQPTRESGTNLDTDSPLSQLVTGIRDVPLTDDVMAELRSELEQLVTFLPTDERLADGGIDLDDDHAMLALAGEAKDLLIGRLLESGDRV